jgi:hypothetical protein
MVSGTRKGREALLEPKRTMAFYFLWGLKNEIAISERGKGLCL